MEICLTLICAIANYCYTNNTFCNLRELLLGKGGELQFWRNLTKEEIKDEFDKKIEELEMKISEQQIKINNLERYRNNK